MKVTVDADRCVASGHCVLAAPAVFDQGEGDGVVILLNDEPGPGQHQAVREAANLCPAAIIHLTGSDR
jgi:ferredoxin